MTHTTDKTCGIEWESTLELYILLPSKALSWVVNRPIKYTLGLNLQSQGLKSGCINTTHKSGFEWL